MKKKIALILSEDYPVPAVCGGAIEELVTILVDQNEIHQEVEFVIFSTDNDRAREIAKNYQHSKIIYLPKPGIFDRVWNRILRFFNRFTKKTLIDIAFYRKAFAYMKQNRMDAIVAEGGKYQELKRFAEEFGKDRIYLHIHHHLLCEPYIDNIYGHIIGISEFASREWMRTTGDAHVIPHTVMNCVNEDKFKRRIGREERQELRAKYGIEEGDTVVLYCGRIQEVKGVKELIQAILAIPDERVKLLVLGAAGSGANTSTPYVEEVKSLAEANEKRIIFTGYVDNAEIYRYYQIADLQVVPSLWEEAAGLITIEGMLSGLPMIVTKSGGMIEYVPKDVGIWVEREGIVENTRDAILKLLSDEELRRSMQEKSLIQAEKFGKEKFYYDYINVFFDDK